MGKEGVFISMQASLAALPQCRRGDEKLFEQDNCQIIAGFQEQPVLSFLFIHCQGAELALPVLKSPRQSKHFDWQNHKNQPSVLAQECHHKGEY